MSILLILRGVDAGQQGGDHGYGQRCQEWGRVDIHLQCPAERAAINNIDQDERQHKAGRHGHQAGDSAHQAGFEHHQAPELAGGEAYGTQDAHLVLFLQQQR